jgi:glycosyltransferase involved in cell wall biosynthesis
MTNGEISRGYGPSPLISVIIPCFNGERFIAAALDSIAAEQHPHVDVIVVDDGSTDLSADIAVSHRVPIQLISKANGGVASARNAGLAAADGDLIAFLDVDDVYVNSKLARQAALLSEHPDVDVVNGLAQRMVLTTTTEDTPGFRPFGDPLTVLALSTSLIRRAVFDRIGGFDVGRAFADDWDWFMRAREAGTIILNHPDVVAEYRRHDTNMTNDVAAGNQQTLEMLKASINRRRQAHGAATDLPMMTTNESK